MVEQEKEKGGKKRKNMDRTRPVKIIRGRKHKTAAKWEAEIGSVSPAAVCPPGRKQRARASPKTDASN